MAPDGMADMAAKIEQLPSTESGVYRFKTNLSMAGRWQLSLYWPSTDTWQRVSSWPTRMDAVQAAHNPDER